MKEPPIAIGAYYTGIQPRQDYTREEMEMQAALLRDEADRMTSKHPIRNIIIVLFVAQILAALVERF